MPIPASATQFIDGVLKEIGAKINSVTVAGFIDWLANEQGGPNLTAFEANRGNPLGIQTTEAQEAGKTGNIALGIKETAKLLTSSADYTNIVKAFRTGTSVQEIATAVTDSPWNGNKYGGLQNYLSVASGAGSLPSNAAPNGAIDGQPSGPGQGMGTTAQLDTSSSGGLTGAEAKEIDTPYTGPGAYKGFDLQGITAGQLANVKQAINTVLAQPGGVKGILNAIYKNYGSEAWMANVPEVRTILVAGSLLGWDSNKALFDSEFQNTNWYKTTAPGARNFDELSANDPASANQAIASASARITNDANSLGVQLTHSEVQSLAKTVASQSISSVTGTNTYDESMVDDAKIIGYITAMAQTPAFVTGLTTAPSTPGAATATSAATSSIGGSGDAAALYNAFTNISKNYMLNWTPQQIAAQVQKALLGDTGQSNFQTGAVAAFTTLAQNTAKALYPAFASTLGSDTSVGDDQNLYQATTSYRNMIAQFTGNADPDGIDLTSPQWSWILSGGTPPTAPNTSTNNAQNTPGSSGTGTTSSMSTPSGTGAPPTIDALQTYLMGTPQFQSTDMAKQMAWHVGNAITTAFGF